MSTTSITFIGDARSAIDSVTVVRVLAISLLITQYNRRRSTRPPTRNALWHKDRHRRLGRIHQKKQGVPENTSHGDPLEDSRCRTERSEIQTSSETPSKPPPDPPHPMKTSPTNHVSDNRAY